MLSQLTSADERIRIGAGTYASGEPLIRPLHPGNRITLGKYCSLAYDVTIFAGGNHPMDRITTHPIKIFHNVGDYAGWTADCADGDAVTRIGSDVWLGHGCTILSGADIGDGAIIGARAVVRGRVPPYAIVAGNPARVIRYRFDDAVIDRLLKIRWWDWPEEKIKAEIPHLTSAHIPSFLRRHGQPLD